jgi:cell wall-associated NlpC family hydrolase
MPMALSDNPVRRLQQVLLVLLLTFAGVTSTIVAAAPAHAATTSPAATAIKYARAQLGDPYQWGAAGPHRFDCSGLTLASYRAAGIKLPRTARDQYAAGHKVARAKWAPGDLVFFGSKPKDARSVYHVAIYLGNGKMLHAPKTGQVVKIVPLRTFQLMPYATRPAIRR